MMNATLLCFTALVYSHQGTPSQLSIGKVTFNSRNITVSWTSPKDDLRPVHGYMITVEMTGAGDKNESSQTTRSTVKRQETKDNKNTQIYHFNFTEGDCKVNPLTETELCEVTLQLDAILGSYTITVCATNSFGTTCASVQQSLDVLPSQSAAELFSNRESGPSLSVIIGLVIGIAVPAALCCVAFTYCTVINRRRRQKQQDTYNDEIER